MRDDRFTGFPSQIIRTTGVRSDNRRGLASCARKARKAWMRTPSPGSTHPHLPASPPRVFSSSERVSAKADHAER
jgi:hypothetical protein